MDYERITTRELKRIVNRGEATPAAIGLFVLHDYWEREHGRRAIVDNILLRYIEGKWQFTPYANELDFWLGLGEQLTRLEYAIERAKLGGVITALDTTMGAIFTQGYLYGAAFYAVYEQAAAEGLKIKIAGLTAKQLETLVTTASEMSIRGQPIPPQRIEETRKKAQSDIAYLLAAQSVIGDAAALLAIPGLPGPVDSALDFLRAGVETHKKRLDTLEGIMPKWAEQLRRMVDYEPIEPDREAEARLEKTIAVYLTPLWREWARAGVNLRELAEGSKGLVDLLRHAEIAAAEVENE